MLKPDRAIHNFNVVSGEGVLQLSSTGHEIASLDTLFEGALDGEKDQRTTWGVIVPRPIVGNL